MAGRMVLVLSRRTPIAVAMPTGIPGWPFGRVSTWRTAVAEAMRATATRRWQFGRAPAWDLERGTR
ncbi:hypothetical protein A5622_06890 [Mycobacterium sp. 1245801.1]|nr:hypothetical protein A5622_06890 [Mycobacterium sp. 1245801.1]